MEIMNKLQKSLFYAKILLFGEYGIIEDSMGLSIPYDEFNGVLKFSDNKNEFSSNSNKDILEFYNYISKLKNQNLLISEFDLITLKKDIDNGLYFDSNIPQGFGVGSSGALVASIYYKYSINKIVLKNDNNGDGIAQLKQIFSQLESFFHGKSSGLDPLICYLNIPVLIKSKTELNTVSMPIPNISGKGAIFLINSGSPGHTQNMVTIFLEKLKNEGFRNLIKNQFIKHNDECINAFLNKENTQLFKSLKNLSQFVYNNFSPMIPENFKSIWKKGIETDKYYLKLCGSGGGGFILGFTPNFVEAQKVLSDHKLQVVYKF